MWMMKNELIEEREVKDEGSNNKVRSVESKSAWLGVQCCDSLSWKIFLIAVNIMIAQRCWNKNFSPGVVGRAASMHIVTPLQIVSPLNSDENNYEWTVKGEVVFLGRAPKT